LLGANMSIAEVLPTVRSLSRADRLRLIQIVAQELAEDEASLIEPNREYPIWSPYDAHDAAATLLRILGEEKSTP